MHVCILLVIPCYYYYYCCYRHEFIIININGEGIDFNAFNHVDKCSWVFDVEVLSISKVVWHSNFHTL